MRAVEMSDTHVHTHTHTHRDKKRAFVRAWEGLK